MSGVDSLFGRILIARANVHGWRMQVEDIDERIREMEAAIVRGEASADAVTQLAAVHATRMTYAGQLQAAERELQALEATQN